MAIRRRTGKRKYRGRRRAKLGIYRGRRLLRLNPSPIFTETYKLTTDLLPNAGFLLSPRISEITQISQYSNLYQKYRILRAKFLIIPNFAGGSDANVAIFNTVSGNFPTLPGVSSAGSSRIVFVIDNSPNQAAPVSEDATLQENGCKIRMLTNMVRMSCRPVPDIKDANNNEITLKGKYLNFSDSGPEIAHYGIRGWINHPYSLGTGSFNIPDPMRYSVYVKLTFQVAEPR